MTPSNESQQESASTDSSAAPAAKAPRRRVTRVAAAPTIKPVTFLTAEPVASAPVVSPVADATAKADEPAVSATKSEPRRSRRVTTAAGAPKSTAAEPIELPAVREQTGSQESAPVEKKLPVLDLPEPKNASKKNARSGRAAKQPLADLDVFAEVAALTGQNKAAPKAVQKAAVAPVPTVAPDSVINLDVIAEEHEAQVAKASRTRSPQRNAKTPRSTEKQTATSAADAQAQEPASAGAESVVAPEPAAATEKAPEPRRRGRGRSQVFLDPRDSGNDRPVAQTPQKPRLATTALLFQAPDLSAAVAPAAPVFTKPVEEETEVEAPRPERAERSNQRGRGRENNRRSRAKDETISEETTSHEVAEPEDSGAVDAVTSDQASSEAVNLEESTAPENGEVEATESAESDSDNDSDATPRRRRRRGGRGRGNRNSSDNGDSEESDDSGQDADTTEAPATESQDSGESTDTDDSEDQDNGEGEEEYSSSRRRRRRRRGTRTGEDESTGSPRTRSRGTSSDEVTALKGSTRLEAKRQRRREGRDAGRRRTIITEAEFLARRESVERSMIVRERDGRTQIAVLEDGVLVEHYVSQQQQASMAGNVYLGRVQNVLPSMEAAFIDVGKGRNAVLYAGEVNWDAAGLDGQPRRIEEALKSGDQVLVQVTKDPIGHKGARLTSQVTLAGRYLVYVPGGGMTGISRKLPDTERARLKRILKEIVPEGAGVIVRTAAEGASEEELKSDVERLQTQWQNIEKKAKTASAPSLLQGEPDLAIRVVRDIFNDDFTSLQVQGNNAWAEISSYVQELAPDLADRVTHWVSEKDIFAQARVDEQLAKGMDRKVWLPSGGSLVIDRTEAMTVIDVNTGKFTGAGGTLEETVTRNNLESAEEIVRQLRLRDIGGIIVIDFIDMVLESNRDLVLRRLVECLGRDRTKHQVAEVTSLGLVQMTRKRVGQGLVEAFSTTCETCNGRGFIVHDEPNERQGAQGAQNAPAHEHTESKRSKRKRNQKESAATATDTDAVAHLDADAQSREAVKATLATIAAAAVSSHEDGSSKQEPAAAPKQRTRRARSEKTTPHFVEETPAEPASTEAVADAPVAAEPVKTDVVQTGVVQPVAAAAEAGSESAQADTLFDAPTADDPSQTAPAKPARNSRARRATGGGKASTPQVAGDHSSAPVGIMVIPAQPEAAVVPAAAVAAAPVDEPVAKEEPKAKQAVKAKAGTKAAPKTKAAKAEPKAKAAKAEPKTEAESTSAAKVDATDKAKAEPKAKTTRAKSGAKAKTAKESTLSDAVADAAAVATAPATEENPAG